MTVQSTTSVIVHVIDVAQQTYPFDLLVLDESHLYTLIAGIPYSGSFTTTGIGDQNGGTIIFDDPLPAESDGFALTIQRIIPIT